MDDLVAFVQQIGPAALFIGLMVLMHVFGHGHGGHAAHGAHDGHEARRDGPADRSAIGPKDGGASGGTALPPGAGRA